jgi:hypothetical protein
MEPSQVLIERQEPLALELRHLLFERRLDQEDIPRLQVLRQRIDRDDLARPDGQRPILGDRREFLTSGRSATADDEGRP